MEDILCAILRQLLISNQMKLMELAKNDSIRCEEEIKAWNDGIKFDLDLLFKTISVYRRNGRE